jgi:tRNA-2-methylthio-N6-dimethylallyladenosine synthase
VLVENKMEKQNKLFGRNKYISPVIFDGNKSHIGKVVKVKVQTSNQNTLFGLMDKKIEAA